jgi:uncharacterized membrane-anchored protein
MAHNVAVVMRLGLIAGLALIAVGPVELPAQENKNAGPQMPKLNWQSGPMKGKLGTMAEVDVPEGYEFIGAQDTQTLMRLYGNNVHGNELGLIQPKSGDDWFLIFEFDSVGYVKDDEKDKLDVDAILDSIKAGTDAGNEERRRRGAPELHVVGWQEKPNYDATTHNLQWAIKAKSEDHFVVNYNTRILGRRGVMEATLVANPDKLAAIVPTYKQLLTKFSYSAGSTYGEFQAGDKIAEYGLTALVAGGGLAVAAKTGLLAKFFGLFAKLGKGAIVLVIGAFAAVKALFSRLFGGRSCESS